MNRTCWENVVGSIQLTFNDDDGLFDLPYHVHDLPGYCDTCLIALVVDKGSCDDDLQMDDQYFDGDRRHAAQWRWRGNNDRSI